MARKPQWSELSPRTRAAIVTGGIVEVVLTTLAVRDLIRRRRDDVRGPKLLWGVGMVVQPFGPLAYLLAGRRT